MLLGALLLLILFFVFFRNYKLRVNKTGLEILQTISYQLNLGERSVGSPGHVRTRDFIISQLQQAGVEYQEQIWEDPSGQRLANIIGRINPDQQRRVIVGTHYDTHNGTPGANDGASGVAVLLQLAKDLSTINIGVDLVFFDAEEFEPGPFTDWKPKGSTYFSNNLNQLYPLSRPELAIVPDLVCKKNLVLKPEAGSIKSAPDLTDALWKIGRRIDSRIFSNQKTGEVKDDHTPLNQVGIPSVLLIDLNYPEFHSENDDLDKCSPVSLRVVYETIKKFLIVYDGN